MASRAPPVPREQRSAYAEGARPPSRAPEVAVDPAGGEADMNVKQRGRHGNMRQNLTPRLRTQDR